MHLSTLSLLTQESATTIAGVSGCGATADLNASSSRSEGEGFSSTVAMAEVASVGGGYELVEELALTLPADPMARATVAKGLRWSSLTRSEDETLNARKKYSTTYAAYRTDFLT